MGEVGGGWSQVMNELAFERSGPERFLSTYPMLAELVRRVGTAPNDRSAVAIGGFAAKLWTLHRMSLAIASLLSQGIAPELEAAMVKDLGTTFEGTSMEIVRQLLPVEPSLSASTRLETLLAEAITHAPGFTLRGGTTEILRGIVARGLGVR
ncbi:MAG: hypothetical protein HY329_05430 [Chloroflexi bacterium]|nr:hypothetical protein [Chloroflexota bacterium]